MAGGLLLSDLRQGRPYQSCLITLEVLLAMHLAWECRVAAGWQAFGKTFAALFF